MRHFKYIFLYAVILIQLTLFAVVFTLEKLYSKKMGVARSLQYRNEVLSQGMFSESMLRIYAATFVIGAAACLAIMAFGKMKDGHTKLAVAWAALPNFAGVYFTIFGMGLGLKAIYFFIMASMIGVLLQYMSAGLLIALERK